MLAGTKKKGGYGQITAASEVESSYRARLIAFYSKYAPEKICGPKGDKFVEAIVKRCVSGGIDVFEELCKKLMSKYGDAPPAPAAVRVQTQAIRTIGRRRKKGDRTKGPDLDRAKGSI